MVNNSITWKSRWNPNLFNFADNNQNNQNNTGQEWIGPEGIICIAVPDCGNPNMLNHSLNNPYHVYHFSKNSLKLLFEKSGYDVIQCDSLSNLKRANRRFHKVMRKAGFNNLSSKTEPFYPFQRTSDRDGYEIRCVIKPIMK